MLKLVQCVSVYSGLVDLRDDREGASLAEYALLLGLVAVAVSLTVALLGTAIGDVLTATAGILFPADGGGEQG